MPDGLARSAHHLDVDLKQLPDMGIDWHAFARNLEQTTLEWDVVMQAAFDARTPAEATGVIGLANWEPPPTTPMLRDEQLVRRSYLLIPAAVNPVFADQFRTLAGGTFFGSNPWPFLPLVAAFLTTARQLVTLVELVELWRPISADHEHHLVMFLNQRPKIIEEANWHDAHRLAQLPSISPVAAMGVLPWPVDRHQGEAQTAGALGWLEGIIHALGDEALAEAGYTAHDIGKMLRRLRQTSGA